MNRISRLAFAALGAALLSGCGGGGGGAVATPVTPGTTVHSAVNPIGYTATLLPNGSDGQPLSIVSISDTGVVTGVGNGEIREWTEAGGATVVGTADQGYFQQGTASADGTAGGKFFVRVGASYTPKAATYGSHAFTYLTDAGSASVDGTVIRSGATPLVRAGNLQPFSLYSGSPLALQTLQPLPTTSQQTGVTTASPSGPLFGGTWQVVGGGSVLPQAVKINGTTLVPTALAPVSGTQLQSNVMVAFDDGSAGGYAVTPTEVDYVFWDASGAITTVGPASSDTSTLPTLTGNVSSYNGFWAGQKPGSGAFVWSKKSGFQLIQSLVRTAGINVSAGTPVAVNNKGWVVVSISGLTPKNYVLKPTGY